MMSVLEIEMTMDGRDFGIQHLKEKKKEDTKYYDF
jgi:hypothetical protein